MEFLPQIHALFAQLMGFAQILDEDDENEDLLRLILRRRSRFVNKYLQRRRLTMERIEAGRTVYFTTYVGTWFNEYPELQFQKDLRLTKRAFSLYTVKSIKVLCLLTLTASFLLIALD